MAYDGSKMHALLDSIGGGSLRAYFYGPTSDDFATITAANYVSDGVSRGLRVNDIVHVYGNGPETARDLIVGSLSGAAATLVDPGFVSLTAFSSQAEAEAGTVTNKIMNPLRSRQAYNAREKRDYLNLLDYATSDSQRASIRLGSVEINNVWDDAIADGTTLGLKNLFAPRGALNIDTDTRLDNPGFSIRGEEGTRFIKNGLNSAFRTLGTTPTVSGGALAANAAVGDLSITLSAGLGAGFSVGQTCILLDQGAIGGGSGQTGQNAEFVRIQGISSDTITFWSPIKLAYTTANTARLIAVTFVDGVAYRGIEIEMDEAATVESSLNFQEMFGIDLRWCRRPIVENVTIHDAVHAGIFLTGCLDARINGYHGYDFGSNTTGTDDPASTEGTPGFGYGIREDALNLGLIAGALHFERCRHGYTPTAGYSSIWDYGWPTGSLISNGVHRDAREAAWDTHAAGDSITFQNLLAIGGRTRGFQIRARRSRVLDCRAEYCRGAALWIRGGASGSTHGDECYVSNFSAERTNLYDDGTFDWRELGAVCDEAFDTVIDGLRVARVGGPAITVGRNGVARRGIYKNIEAKDPCLLAATKTYVIDILNANSSANIEIDGLLVHDAGGEVSDLIRRGTANIRIGINNARGYGYTGALFSAVDDPDLLTTIRNSDGPRLIERRGLRIYDDFEGRTLDGRWNGRVGTDAQVVTPTIFNGLNGICRLVTGDDAAADMATNGVQLEGFTNFEADKGSLAIEGLIRISAITAVAVFFGFTDQVSALEMPFTLGGGDALTSNATDGVGFLFDTGADTDNIWLVGVANDVDATKQNAGVALVASTYMRLRIELTTAGVATFYINGAKVGTAMTGAVTASTLLTPYFGGFSRGAASRNLDVDYIAVEQSR